ncbi:DNA pilot protein [Blackfly microvirus SF02]|uniref:DNA pilot protein n=1 Tax=Blackfly microvirus SF02 TaxID=2576452 RepID=A0A4P8PKX7_9VIRU|nr:DNA pilot protein [Blackfly microvirus SF02]
MALGAIATIGSSLLGGLFGKSGAEKQNKAQALEAQKQRDFQQYNADTAHQREIKDLKAAGLNPILSGTGGSGAPAPGGAQANVVNEMSEMSSSARDISSKLQQSPLINAQVANTKLEGMRIGEQIKQLQINNAQQGVYTPVYKAAGAAVDQALGHLQKKGLQGIPDIVSDVLEAAKTGSSAVSDGEINLPNSAKTMSLPGQDKMDVSRSTHVYSPKELKEQFSNSARNFSERMSAPSRTTGANSPRELWEKAFGGPKKLTEEGIKDYAKRHYNK